MNVIFYVKRDFADVIKLRILRWEDYPKLSRCILNILHKCLIRVIQDGLSKKKKKDSVTFGEAGGGKTMQRIFPHSLWDKQPFQHFDVAW